MTSMRFHSECVYCLKFELKGDAGAAAAGGKWILYGK